MNLAPESEYFLFYIFYFVVVIVTLAGWAFVMDLIRHGLGTRPWLDAEKDPHNAASGERQPPQETEKCAFKPTAFHGPAEIRDPAHYYRL